MDLKESSLYHKSSLHNNLNYFKQFIVLCKTHIPSAGYPVDIRKRAEYGFYLHYKGGEGTRVVTVSSIAHEMGAINFDDINFR